MRFLSRLILPMLVLLFSGAPAFAQGASWTISEAKGTVIIIDDTGERAAKAGSQIASGAVVRTKARSTAVMVRGREFVTLRQNAQIRIPAASRQRTVFQVIQDYGTALFKIGKQADPHFGVETPYLAAVVKGTSFVITVTDQTATLQVTEGAVEVSTNDGGARDLILPGQAAMVAAADTMRMVVEGDGRKVIDSPARPAPNNESAPEAVPGDETPETPVRGSAENRAANQNAAIPNRAMASNGANGELRGGRIDRAIMSTPGDIGQYSGGLVSGQVAVLAVAVADNVGRGAATPFAAREVRSNDGVACQQGGCAAPSERPAEIPGNGNLPAVAPGNQNGNGQPNGPGSAPGNSGSNNPVTPPGNGNAPANPPGNSGNATPGNSNAPGNAPGNGGGTTPATSPGNGNAPGNPYGNPGGSGPPNNPGNTPGNGAGGNPGGLGSNSPNNNPANQPRTPPGGTPDAGAGPGIKP